MTKFRIEFNKLLHKSGRRKGWVIDKMGMYRMEFWRKMNKDLFTEKEKQKINSLLR